MAQIAPTATLFLKPQKPSQSLHKSIKPFTIVANCLGLLPVDGVTSNSIDDLRFKWTSPKTLYSFFVMLQAVCGIVLIVIALFNGHASVNTMTTLCLYCSWLFQLTIYLYLASKWPELMKKWHDIDLSMQRVYGYPSGLDVRIKFTTIVAFVAAIVYVVFTFRPSNQMISDVVERFYATIGTQYIDVQLLRGLVLINFTILICIWLFNDLFVILISTALALRFKQVTERVLINATNMQSLDFWSEIRTDYIQLFKLCQLINECCPFQITLSFANDVWFILVDFFLIIKYSNTEYGTELTVCYIDFMSCCLLVVCTTFYAAWVNDESKRFAVALNSIPSRNHNLAIQVLQEQIPLNPVALSGNNIFGCTRGLILNIIGAVITYELLLIQFSDVVISR